MLNTDPNTMEALDAFVIMSHGIAAALFTFAPIILIVSRELGKWSKQGVSEHAGGESLVTFLITQFIVLGLVSILYIVFVQILILLNPDWDPISGQDGIVALFWDIDIPNMDEDSTMDRSAAIAFLYTIKILRSVFETISFISVFLILIFATKLAFTFLSALQNNSDGGKIIMSLIKISIGMYIGYYAVLYYDKSTKNIISHPSGKGVHQLSIDWITKGIEIHNISSEENN